MSVCWSPHDKLCIAHLQLQGATGILVSLCHLGVTVPICFMTRGALGEKTSRAAKHVLRPGSVARTCPDECCPTLRRGLELLARRWLLTEHDVRSCLRCHDFLRAGQCAASTARDASVRTVCYFMQLPEKAWEVRRCSVDITGHSPTQKTSTPNLLHWRGVVAQGR